MLDEKKLVVIPEPPTWGFMYYCFISIVVLNGIYIYLLPETWQGNSGDAGESFRHRGVIDSVPDRRPQTMPDAPAIARSVYIISDLHLGGAHGQTNSPNSRGFRMCTHSAR